MRIEQLLTIISLIIAVATVLYKLAQQIITLPLTNTINRLSDAIDRLNLRLSTIESMQSEVRERLAQCEASCKSAHLRIDELRGERRNA